MLLYVLYRIGFFISNLLPLSITYVFASLIAEIYYLVCANDRNSVQNNLKTILGGSCSDAELKRTARGVFRNFAKYLADFFRFSKIDDEYIKKHINIVGLENVDKGLRDGKGVIALSAHIGNWELGGLIVSLLRQPMQAVVLTHKNKNINDFFTRQRSIGNMRPVEIGIGLRACYTVLKKNGILAVLGDRDFSKNGFWIEFFGKKTLIPRGPAVFSYRLGSCIVPVFMIREEDDNFTLIFEEPIYPDVSQDEEISTRKLAKAYSSVIESYVKKYPSQWYMFKEVWNNHEKMRPDTGV